MGDFDRVGTPHHYMIAGWFVIVFFLVYLHVQARSSPSLTANLWDVTDGDIDKVAQSVIDRMHLNATDIKAGVSASRTQVSLPAAVAQSRDVCKLKYLTGASTVVYGIPWYL